MITLSPFLYAQKKNIPLFIEAEKEKLESCDTETMSSHIALQRETQRRFPEEMYATGFSPWKKMILKEFLHKSQVTFVSHRYTFPKGATVVIWGNIPPEGLPNNTHLIRIEDGFLRSVGLGADLIKPVSWVIDQVGLYYDASRPSGIEDLIQNHSFDNSLLERAKSLREKIVGAGLTKYNLKGIPWEKPKTNQRLILVPGQVESDASIQFGSVDIKTNMGLLKAVRQQCPEAYIIYKPHPDVVAGLRKIGHQEKEAAQWCDEIVTHGNTLDIIDQVDEVHTLTSLLGFEALLRHKPVTCYGQPFYAGWGLTTDQHPVSRRTRKISLEELVAGSLILYPTYISHETGHYTTPEQAIDNLLLWRRSAKLNQSFLRQLTRRLLKLSRLMGITKE